MHFFLMLRRMMEKVTGGENGGEVIHEQWGFTSLHVAASNLAGLRTSDMFEEHDKRLR